MKSIEEYAREVDAEVEAAKSETEQKNQHKAANGAAKPEPIKLIPGSEFVRDYKAPPYLVKGVIQRKRLYSVTGKTGAGKTAWALSIAVELSLLGMTTVYLAAENPDDVRGRLILMIDRLRLSKEVLDRIQFVEGGFDIDANFGLVRDCVAAIGGANLAIVDTAVAFMAQSGVEQENDNTSLYRFAMQARQLTELQGNPAVVTLAHPIKACSSQDALLPRGGGSFINEVDGNLTLWASEDRETTELSWCGKFRGPSFEPVVYALEVGTCADLVDAEGNLMPSVWAYRSTEQRVEQAEENAEREEDALLLLLSTKPGQSQRQWAEYLGWYYHDPKDDRQPNHTKIRRVLARLEKHGLAKKHRRKWTITEAGKKELGK